MVARKHRRHSLSLMEALPEIVRKQCLTAMKHGSIDEEAVTGSQIKLLTADHNVDRTFRDNSGFQFIVPVPGDFLFGQIIVITGTWKSRGTVLNLLAEVPVYSRMTR